MHLLMQLEHPDYRKANSVLLWWSVAGKVSRSVSKASGVWLTSPADWLLRTELFYTNLTLMPAWPYQDHFYCSDWVKVLRPLDTQLVISETFFPANLLAKYWRN